MTRIWYLSLLFLLFFCNCRTKDHPFVHLKVAPEFESHDKVKLKVSISSNRDSLFLWDWDAMSIETPNPEKEVSINPKDGLKEILNKLRYPQVIIENEKSERRFFSEVRLFEGETIEAVAFDMIGPPYDTIRALPGKEVFLESRYIYVNRFKIAESDTTIRLHYLFKPTKEQELSGFKPLIITSEWFSLKR